MLQMEAINVSTKKQNTDFCDILMPNRLPVSPFASVPSVDSGGFGLIAVQISIF